ncbi:MAG: hypothetical protein AAFV69_10195 [Pseudomonadota bacterium]
MSKPSYKPSSRAVRPNKQAAASSGAKGLPKGYVALWAMLGLVSTGYIGVATLSATSTPPQPTGPILVERSGPEASNTSTSRQSVAGIDAALKQRLAEKRRSLAQVVDELQRPADTESNKVEPSAQQQKLAGQLRDGAAQQNGPGILASKTVRTTTVAGLVKRHTSGGATPPLKPAAPVGVSIINGTKPTTVTTPAAAVQLAQKVAAPVARKTAPIITGSIKPPPLPIRGPKRPKLRQTVSAPVAARVAKPAKRAAKPTSTNGFGTAQVARAQPATPTAQPSRRLGADQAPRMGVRLAVAPSVDGLRLQWTLLRERHGRYLGALSPRYIQTSRNGAPASYELVAGPVAGAIQALELCQDVSRHGTRCVIGDFVGNAL